MTTIALTKRLLLPLALLLVIFNPTQADEGKFRVLVVMSYEQDNPWCEEIRAGIESVLGETSHIEYAYMDTKVNFQGGEERARQAWERFQQFQPDGVISVDDNAQWMFVNPYVVAKSNTPVMFCGVNAEPDKYGFPNEQVSGVLERGHIRESLAFIRQLSPSIETVCFLVRNSPSGQALFRQIDREHKTYPAKLAGRFAVRNVDDIKAASEELNRDCDAIYIDSLEGIAAADGSKLDNQGALDAIKQHYRGPLIGANSYHVDQGALSAVVKTGQEQGETAAAMLLEAMRGKPVRDIPVTRNYKGRRIINVSVMDELKLTPRPIVLRGAKLVTGSP